MFGVFAADLYGRAGRLSASSTAAWQLRTLVAMGALSPAPVPMPRAAGRARHTRGFRDLLACRWWYEASAPTPFPISFVAEWYGMSTKATQAAIRALSAGGQTMPLFMPGTVRKGPPAEQTGLIQSRQMRCERKESAGIVHVPTVPLLTHLQEIGGEKDDVQASFPGMPDFPDNE